MTAAAPALPELTPELLAALPPELQAEALAILENLTGGERLADFIARIHPRRPPQRHMMPIIEAVERAKYKPIRLCISVPPRHGKTVTLLNALGWWLAGSPADTCGYFTYSDTMGRSKSRLARAVARKAGIELAGDAANLTEWRTMQGGGFLAGGVGGMLTGQGLSGLCFPAGTMVATERGPMEISALAASPDKPRVVSFDHETRTLVLRRVVASADRWVDELAVVRTGRGRSIRATVDHPFWTEERGYREAALLRGGDTLIGLHPVRGRDLPEEHAGDLPDLLRPGQEDDDRASMPVRGDVRVASIRVREDARQRPGGRDLRQAMHGRDEIGADGEAAPVPDVRRVDRGEGRRGDEAILRKRVLAGEAAETEARAGAAQVEALPDVQNIVRHEDDADGVLLTEVRRRGPFQADDRDRKLALQGRDELRALVPGDEAADPSPRRALVPSVRSGENHGESREAAPFDDRDPSHRRGPGEQRPGEPDRSVQDVPRDPPQVERDAVSSVARDRCGPVRVYDIEVEGTHCFFADEVLVHNCVIDDPYKNRQDVDSPLMRERVVEWFNEVVMTRLEGASVIVVHTRWREDDLIGHLVKENGWDMMNLPAIAEENDPIGRAVGEALWPSRFDVEFLESQRRQMGDFGFSALYQGKPRRKGASVFSRDPVYYDPRKMDWTGWSMTIGADPAGTAKTSSDYSACLALATRGRGAEKVGAIVEVYRQQTTVPAFARELLRFRERNWKGRLGVEAVGGFKALPDILRELAPGLTVEELEAKGDKFTRAQPAASAWNDGRIMIPSCDMAGRPVAWLDPFLEELRAFTGVNDDYDDQVDSLSGAWNLSEKPRPVPARVGVRVVRAG